MSWESCVITLNSDSTGSLYAGDIVTGSVLLEFKQLQKVQKIEFTVLGSCKLQWTRPSPTLPHIKFYSEKKKLLYISINVFESIQGIKITPGFYTYPFHFVLPQDLPSSFESSIAKVNYYIKLKSLGVWGNKKIEQLTVLGNVNLNHLDTYLMPQSYEVLKKCWNNKTVEFYIKTFTGFSSDQCVPLKVNIRNKNKITISKLSVNLIQKLRYTIKEGQALVEKKKCKFSHIKFLNAENELLIMNMDIPKLVPSSVHIQDPMIDISYIFRISINFTFHSTIYMDIPVIVATVPVLHHALDIDE